MRVTFVVSVPQEGAGGHYHSLAALAGEFHARGAIEALVVTVGRKRSRPIEALRGQGIEVQHVAFDGLNLLGATRNLFRAVKTFRPQVVHAFDEHAYFFARLIAASSRCGLLLTKCGGPTPRGYFPRVDRITVFSEEDQAWFERRPDTQVTRIPNRVRSFEQDEGLISEIRGESHSRLKMLRISRIAKHYEKTLGDSIRLLVRLRKRGLDVELLIVGKLYDEKVFRRLSSITTEGVRWIQEDRFTADAKRVIGVADIVIGTGRSLMEAVMCQRAVLCPVAGASIPCLLRPENFGPLFRTNFSERGMTEIDEGDEFERIVDRLTLGSTQEEKEFLSSIGRRYFDIGPAVPRYLELYESLASKAAHLRSDVVLHGMRVAFVFTRQAWRERRLGRHMGAA